MQIMGPSVRTEPATSTNPCGINATPPFTFLSLHPAQHTRSITKAPQSKRTLGGVSCLTKTHRLPAHNTPLVTQFDPPTAVAPMARPRASGSVRTIVESAVPNVRVETISIIPTTRLLRAFRIKLADGRILLLKLPPPPPSRLLRSEQWLLQSEAAVLGWLSGEIFQHHEKSTRRLIDTSVGEGPRRESSPRRQTDSLASNSLPPLGEGQLVDYVPSLIKHSSTSTESSSAFSLFESVLGDPISSMGVPLTDAERKSIDFEKGRLMRLLANNASPNGRFGPAGIVLGQSRASENARRVAREAKLDFDGAESWRKTFHLLLEGILRDGEDLAVTMSYELVRATFHKFGHLLDAVKTPRLVICDGDEDEVVLVSRPEKILKHEHKQEARMPERGPAGWSPESRGGSSNDDISAARITGLQDWGNCIFGDPLFATAFFHTTPEFDLGFQQLLETYIAEREENTSDYGKQLQRPEPRWPSIIEDPYNAQTRLLLYECYHATVSIVRQFYRPDADSSEREIAARRRLVAALAKLENVGVGVGASPSTSVSISGSESTGKRSRPVSRDDWPAKRPRGDTPTPRGVAR